MPADARRIAPGVDLVEDDVHGGVVFLEGIAAWCWAAGDEPGRRLAMVGLVEAGAARHGEVAAGFGCAEVTLWRHRTAYAAGGAAALTPARRGPRRASRLTSERLARIRRLREQGVGLAAIAEREGVARSTVIRALAAGHSAADAGSAGRDDAPPDRPGTEGVGQDQLDVADDGIGGDIEDHHLDLEGAEGIEEVGEDHRASRAPRTAGSSRRPRRAGATGRASSAGPACWCGAPLGRAPPSGGRLERGCWSRRRR